jgi:hypothetical protein
VRKYCRESKCTCQGPSKLLLELVDGLHNQVSLRQLAHFHRAVGAAREEPRPRVDVQLRHALTDVFEETRARVLAGEHEVRLQRGHAPNL